MLIALLISLGLLGVVIGLTAWYQGYKGSEIDTKVMVITDAIGFVIMYGIVYHFVKTPDEEETWK